MRWARLSTALRLGCTIRDRSFVAPASRRLSRGHLALGGGGGTPHDRRRDGGATRTTVQIPRFARDFGSALPLCSRLLKRLNLLIPLNSVKIMVCLSLPEATLGSEATRKGT